MIERIFISSVQAELAQERRAVAEFIRHDPLLSRFFDVFLFEDLPAGDQRADAVYLGEVERAGVYVGLFGSNYGSEDREGVSPTEREFDHATANGKSRLIFIKGMDDAARHPKMQALIAKAGGQVIHRRFAMVSDLTAALYASLVENLERTGRLRTKPFDAAACPEATLADLSTDKLDLFLARAQSQRGYPLGPGTPMETALAHLNLLDGGHPSHAAVLLFGHQPQRFLLASEVKCAHFHGTEVQKPIPSYQIYKGTVFELVDQAVDFVMSKIARTVGTRALSAQAPVEYEVPREAVTEAIVNAVAHRDYTSNASVQVMLFADRLEVWNPGELRPPLTLESLTGPHPSIPPNPLVAEPLYLSKYAEKAGSGILDMISQCAAAGLHQPTFRQETGSFIQILWRPGAEGISWRPERAAGQVGTKLGLSGDQVRVLGELAEEQSLTALMAVFGRSNRTKFRDQVVNPLIEMGLVEMTIPEKPKSSKQRYRITPKGRARLTASAKRGAP